MGQIRNLIRNLDSSEEAYNDQRELIEALAQLAEAKADGLALQIEKQILELDSAFNKTFPPEGWIDTFRTSFAVTSAGSRDVTQDVIAGVRNFIRIPAGQDKTTNIINGVTGLLESVLEQFLSADAESNDSRDLMLVYFNGLIAERLDLRIWQKEIKHSGIKKEVQRIAVLVAVRSTLDLARIKMNTFLSLYGRQLTSMGYGDNDLMKALDAAKHILSRYKEFN